MIDIQPDQARTLAAIVAHGSFEAAAGQLSVTASAVSQRVRALEIAVGRPVLQRTRPVELTDAGQAVVRFARQLDMLSTDLAEELQPGVPRAGTRLALVINSDSLHTWVLPALAEVSGTVQLEILREDQDYSLELLRSGAAAAAITATAAPAPGCRSRSLGTMRYLAVCAPSFAADWFSGGVSTESLAEAPVVTFDRKDELQDRFLRLQGHQRLKPPRHYVPAAHEFSEAIRLGMGWGMVPEIEIAADLELQRLRELVPGSVVDVPLYWQQWRYGSAALDDVAAAVSHEAARLLR
ncbi:MULTISPECIES: ArgP/LysG family DNA-binding transcriptional regulator [Arthrobacter]|uniref:ArgP/LysG family DNA-binding transcriptional regulator n=1 Tax=Arthrobacter oryzae TaxID=409290 RepID=A0A3N0BNJ0_9MICC|nr:MULTISPECIES: ArgP/LysG family DNA-binding transcriptional regulator [Arthrobacter]QYF88672.1 ArgP/LysG family DNA-binding transcriptional regulator [Arthrobacter sp. PAMC25284]RNL49887.1 ArgP/LysG family DNA-binding transcriptional regulator [Arthrobacter oryzae]